MHKLLTRASLVSATVGSLLFSTAVPALAATEKVLKGCKDINDQAGTSLLCSDFSASSIIGTTVAILFTVAALLAFLFLIIGGIRWILSGGDKEGTAKARATITAAIIGLAVVFLSFVVMKILGGILGFDLFNIQLPKFGS